VPRVLKYADVDLSQVKVTVSAFYEVIP